MSESLKALQLAQRALLALVGALFVFVASIDRTPGPYEAALWEMRTLQKVMPAVRKAIVDEEQSNYASSAFAKIVVDAAKSMHIDSQNVKFNVAISSMQMNFSPPMYLADSPQKIDDYYNYIKLSPKFSAFQIYEFEETELRRELDKLLPLVGPKLSEVYLGPMLDEKYKEVAGKCRFSIALPNSGAAREGTELKESGPIKCRIYQWVPHKRATEILAKNGLFTEQDGYILPLPAQAKVWSDVSGIEIQSAIGVLERKSVAEIAQRKGSANSLGLVLNANAVGLVGPALELLLLLYLFAVATQLSSTQGADLARATNFPDIAILRTSTGCILFLSTVVVLPVVTTIIIILSSFESEAVRYIYATLFSLGWVTLSSQLFYRLWSIARMSSLA